MSTARRISVIVATRAAVACVLRPGPGKWWSVHRWDIDRGGLEAGAWLHGNLYPQRSDLSPDGELLLYFALKSTSREFLGKVGVQTYSAVSKVPWLFALAAWPEMGTWTRGHHFVEGAPGARPWDIGEHAAGDAAPLRRRYGVASTRPLQYAVEQRRGWIEHESCPPRDPRDPWDEKRSAVLVRPRPVGKGRLVLTDLGWNGDHRDRSYHVETGRRVAELPEVTWADWDHRGRLLVATTAGRLQIRDPDSPAGAIVREHDLGSLQRAPGPAPAWARRW